MLQQIYVKNFVLIDELQLDLYAHMSSFTGETGAGKSLLMDAISTLMGERVNASFIKQGHDKAIVEGVFQVPTNHICRQQLEDAGFLLEEDIFIVTREIMSDGKSIARCNHRTVTATFLRDVVGSLLDIHSQHDSQYLLHSKYHLHLLDQYANNKDVLLLVHETYHAYKILQDELNAALQHSYNEEDLEFLTFQLNEIDEMKIKEHELDELHDKQKAMAGFEKTSEAVNYALQQISDEQKAMDLLYDGCRSLQQVQDDKVVNEIGSTLLDSYYVIDEAISKLSTYIGGLEFDDKEFDDVQERIFKLQAIYRKYGPTYQDILIKRVEIEKQIDLILHRQEFIDKHEKSVKEAYDVFLKEATKLHEIRKKAAKELEYSIIKELQDLHLEHARFQIAFDETHANEQGIDKVEFLISMNLGEPLKPLNKVASGGELSRLMLGLKTIFTSLQGIQTVIFDEIDTGVSGKVAFAIGKKMQRIADKTQVLCVTHLAQVAACSDQQYLVIKQQENQHTTTQIELLDTEGRVKELAQIASGSSSPSALEAAKELLIKAVRSNG